ncbi:MAG: hypothetical protein H6Q72_3894 [Firmicutes bacterium]|nr:hypothetical protein [Bacillota bacterium]
MDFKAIINSPAMWLACGMMVMVVIGQSIVFLRAAFKAAPEMGLSRQDCFTAMRAAAYTAFGPALGPVVILIVLMDTLGAPTAWMRLLDIGAAHTELVSSTLGAQVYGVDLRSAAFDLTAFSYSSWAMALNNMGWMIVTLLVTPKMEGAISTLTKKTNPRLVALLSAGAGLGLFSYLLSNQLVSGKPGNVTAAVAAAVAFLLLGFCSKKFPRLREFSLGIAMMAGIFAAQAML